MKQPKKYKSKMATKWNAALISGADALNLAKSYRDSFKCETDGLCYTYEDIAINASIPYTMVEIDDSQNDSMLLIEWNGTGPVFRGRKMFPR